MVVRGEGAVRIIAWLLGMGYMEKEEDNEDQNEQCDGHHNVDT